MIVPDEIFHRWRIPREYICRQQNRPLGLFKFRQRFKLETFSVDDKSKLLQQKVESKVN